MVAKQKQVKPETPGSHWKFCGWHLTHYFLVYLGGRSLLNIPPLLIRDSDQPVAAQHGIERFKGPLPWIVVHDMQHNPVTHSYMPCVE